MLRSVAGVELTLLGLCSRLSVDEVLFLCPAVGLPSVMVAVLPLGYCTWSQGTGVRFGSELRYVGHSLQVVTRAFLHSL